MDDTKHPLKSLGIVGPSMAILVGIANHIWPGLGLTSADVAPILDEIDGLAGLLLGIYGRIKATKQIALTVLVGFCLVQLAACTPDLSQAIAQAKEDHASICASVVGMWGTVSVARSNEPGTTIKCPGEIAHGMTMKPGAPSS